MEGNYVYLEGEAMRDAFSKDCGGGELVLDFTLAVDQGNGDKAFIDCRTSSKAPAFGKLEGFVEKDEIVRAHGHLVRHTSTWKNIRVTQTIIFVDDVEEEEEEEDGEY